MISYISVVSYGSAVISYISVGAGNMSALVDNLLRNAKSGPHQDAGDDDRIRSIEGKVKGWFMIAALKNAFSSR
jgi:hypothetical protein